MLQETPYQRHLTPLGRKRALVHRIVTELKIKLCFGLIFYICWVIFSLFSHALVPTYNRLFDDIHEKFRLQYLGLDIVLHCVTCPPLIVPMLVVLARFRRIKIWHLMIVSYFRILILLCATHLGCFSPRLKQSLNLQSLGVSKARRIALVYGLGPVILGFLYVPCMYFLWAWIHGIAYGLMMTLKHWLILGFMFFGLVLLPVHHRNSVLHALPLEEN